MLDILNSIVCSLCTVQQDPGCGMSVAIRGDKSFLRANPSMSSVVTSLENITCALTNARDEWWKRSTVSFSADETSKYLHTNRDAQTTVSFHLPDSSIQKTLLDIEEKEEEEEEEFVDLQAQSNNEANTPSQWKKICHQSFSSLKKRFFPNSDATHHEDDPSSMLQKKTKVQTPLENENEPIQPITLGPTHNLSDSPATLVYDKLDDDMTSVETPFPTGPRPFSPSIDVSPIAKMQSQNNGHDGPTITPTSSTMIRICTDMSGLIPAQIYSLSPPTTWTTANSRIVQKYLKTSKVQWIIHPSSCYPNPDNSLNVLTRDLDFDFESPHGRNLYKSHIFGFKDLTCDPLSNTNKIVPALYSLAFSCESEFRTSDGFLVTRSFRFILAIASCMSIVDISFLCENVDPKLALVQSCCSKFEESAGRAQRSSSRTYATSKVYNVIGDTHCAEWMGPKRSREALWHWIGQWNQNPSHSSSCTHMDNGLLRGYTVYLLGEFDINVKEAAPQQNRNDASSQMKSIPESNHLNFYSHGRVSLLLELCGAKVITSMDSFTRHDDETGLIIVRTGLKGGDSTDIYIKLQSMPSDTCCAVVTVDWLLESIAEFKVRPLDQFKIHV